MKQRIMVAKSKFTLSLQDQVDDVNISSKKCFGLGSTLVGIVPDKSAPDLSQAIACPRFTQLR